MNKKAIWAIIGLMSLALIGIIILQAYWINWSIDLEEKRFDKDVFEALNQVAHHLQEYEEIIDFVDILPMFMNVEENGFSKRVKQRWGEGEDMNVIDFVFQNKIDLDSLLSDKNLLSILDPDNLCTCFECERRRKEIANSFMKKRTRQFVTPPPIEERISLKMLDKYLKQELKSKRIGSKYSYGIFSNYKNTFVITDGHYVVENDGRESTQVSQFSQGNLINSKYFVNLFSRGMDKMAPGLLMIHFPSKTSVVWRSGWKPLLASILFTGIILFCFTYSVQVIFRQKKISEMKTDFINNMTHEFKTPIATISLAADSISSPMISGSPDKVSRFAEIIRQENKRMNNQVEKVLQMAQIDKREYQLNLSPVDLHEIINRAIEHASLQVEKKDGIVTSELLAKNPVIEADVTHVSNMVHNLLDNANKYSPKNPEISVHTRNVSGGVEVIVKDRGIGMSKEARKHIFDKFYRVHTGNLHDVKGFGLGLSYVKVMMTAHKGTVDVKSELDSGSSFILFFPFKHENPKG